VDYSDVKKAKTVENSIKVSKNAIKKSLNCENNFYKKIQPVVKPTAVRAKIENSVSLQNSTPNSISLNNNISSAASVAASLNSSINSKPLISSTPSKNYQPSAAQILAQNNSNNNIQSPSTIPTAPIAFSAVAKQNPGQNLRTITF
jgi:hypothetical protein